MQEIIKRWLYPPVFPGDENKTRQAQILYSLLATMLVFLLLATLGTIFIFVNKVGTGIFIICLLALVLVSYALGRRRSILAASRLFVTGAWASFFIFLLLTGKLTTAIAAISIAIVIMAGILLGVRSTIILAIISSLSGLALVILESTGHPFFHYFPITPLSNWIVWVLAIILVLIQLNLVIQSVVRSTEVLREKEMRFRNIYSQSPIAIELYDGDGLLIDVNPACLELFGISDVEVVKGFNLFEDPNVPENAKQNLLAGQAVNYQAIFDFELVKEKSLYETTRSGRYYLDCFITPWLADNDILNGFLVHIRDITERKQAEAAILESEERLELALEGSQLGYWDWNLKTGEVKRNARWAEMLGYTLDEIEFNVDQWIDLHHPDDRDFAWKSIRDHLEGRTPEHKIEYRMRAKDGQYRWILDRAKIVSRDSDGKPIRMSGTHTDVTDRKRSEHIIQARLRVNEFAREHSLSELLQNALDELCALTDSPIGFFHFVEPDQRTLSLQAWSTRTIEEMCTAEGKGHQYDIEAAGVWVDCVRLGEPVIHNDYAKLPHRRGLPEGHAPIIREMIFPITRNQKMMAIIGVGNKMQDYTKSDLEYASRLADFLWDITERKRAEEREREQRDLAEALSDSAAALNSTLDFNEVLNRIMENVGHVVPHDSVDMILLDITRNIAHVVRHRDTRDQPMEMMGVQFSLEQTRNLREMYENGAPVIIADTHTYDGWVTTAQSAWVQANLGVPITIKGEIIGFLALNSATPNAFSQMDSERLQAFVNHAAIAIENARLYEEVQKLAVTDALTGLFNRAFFNAELARLESSRDYPVSIVMADLDNLKITNDTHGHLAGDELLKRTAKVLQSVFRSSDILTRIGGDEFAVLLPRTDQATVKRMLSRIQEKLHDYNIEQPDLPISLSLGASTAEQSNLAGAFVIADQRMYANKVMRKSSKKE